MQVYLGLYISNLCWNDGNYQYEIEQNKLFIDETNALYKKYKSFIGWYIPHEAGDNSYNLKDTMKGLIALCKEKTPEKKILISPFFRDASVNCPLPTYTPKETAQVWDDIFAYIGNHVDVCAFQDGSAALENLAEYLKELKEVCHKYDCELWANVETFERDVRTLFFPNDFRIIRKKLEIEKEYCDNYITFEFSHFMSPNSFFESARNLYNLYKDYYK